MAETVGTIKSVHINTEATWGTAAAGATALAVDSRDVKLGEFVQEMIARDTPRPGMTERVGFGGRKSGKVEIKLPVCYTGAVPAGVASVFDPDPWVSMLWAAVLGTDAAAEGAMAASEPQKGHKGASSIIVTVASDPIATLNVTGASGSRFEAGCVVVARRATTLVPHPMLVTFRNTDALTVAGGPAAASGLTADDRVMGCHTMPVPYNTVTDAAISVQEKDILATPNYRVFTGCSGNAVLDVEAGKPATWTFTLDANEWTSSAAAILTPVAAGADVWPARTEVLGSNCYFRIGTAGAAPTLISASKMQLDLGVTRKDGDDINGPQGRSSRPVVSFKPILSCTVPFDRAWLTGFAAGTTYHSSAFIGSAANSAGGQGFFIRAMNLAELPKESNDGFHSLELKFTPLEDTVDAIAPALPTCALSLFSTVTYA